MSISRREFLRRSAESAALTILDSPEHAWMKGMSPEGRSRIDEFYRQRYGTSKVQ